MSEQEKQESQKTIVAFAAGLLIGGLLVWIFGGSPKQEEVKENVATTTPTTEVVKTDTTAEGDKETTATVKPVLVTGEGKIVVGDVKAGSIVTLTSATFPTDEGWITVRESNNGQLSGLLGAARYSKEQGLIPTVVSLERPMVAGNTYALVFYSESGDKVFTQALDTQIDKVAPTIFVAK